MKSLLKIFICALIFIPAQAQYAALYDLAADKFIPYQYVPIERRNISPDCEQRTTIYPVFDAQVNYPNISAANARIRRMYTYYMSDTFVDELQKSFHKVVLNYQKHFPNQLNCINEQKVYAVNFTTMDVSIVSCQNGKVMMMNSLYYTVANAPVSEIQNNIYNEVIQVDLQSGALQRNPLLIRKEKEKEFTALVKRQLDLFLEAFKTRGGEIKRDLDYRIEEEVDYSETEFETDDYPMQETQYEAPVVPSAPVTTYNYTYNSDAQFPPKKRTEADSAISLIKYQDLQVYWRNFSVFVRVSRYADLAAYLPNTIIEVDFSWNELKEMLVSSPSVLFKNNIQLTEENLRQFLGEVNLYAELPFYQKHPERVNGIRKMTVSQEFSGNKDEDSQVKRSEFTYDELGRITEIKVFQASDTTPLSKTSYVYKGNELKQIIQYDKTGNISSIQPAGSLSISKHDGFYLVTETNQYRFGHQAGYTGEFRVYVLEGRLIIEPRGDYSLSEENAEYSLSSTVIYFNNSYKRIADFSLDHQSSVYAEQTAGGIVPGIRRFVYDDSNRLLATNEQLAEYNNGLLIFVGAVNDNSYQEYKYDMRGRIIQVTEMSYNSVQKTITLKYNGTGIYPESIEVIAPAYRKTIKYTLKAE